MRETGRSVNKRMQIHGVKLKSRWEMYDCFHKLVSEVQIGHTIQILSPSMFVPLGSNLLTEGVHDHDNNSLAQQGLMKSIDAYTKSWSWVGLSLTLPSQPEWLAFCHCWPLSTLPPWHWECASTLSSLSWWPSLGSSSMTPFPRPVPRVHCALAPGSLFPPQPTCYSHISPRNDLTSVLEQQENNRKSSLGSVKIVR